MFYWMIKYIFVGPWIWLMGRPTFEGRENFPKTGAAVLAINHLGVMDWLFLPLRSPRKLSFLAKSEYFTTPGLKGRWYKFFFTETGQVPVDRSGSNAGDDAMNTGVRILNSGRLLGVFVEGTRSPDGRLYRGKTGAARMAMRAGVPIVPIGLTGTGDFLPEGKLLPRPTKIRVMVGEPLDLSPWQDRLGDREAEREITDEIMRRIQALTGQEYVHDTYGADEKKRLAAERDAGTSGT